MSASKKRKIDEIEIGRPPSRKNPTIGGVFRLFPEEFESNSLKDLGQNREPSLVEKSFETLQDQNPRFQNPSILLPKTPVPRTQLYNGQIHNNQLSNTLVHQNSEKQKMLKKPKIIQPSSKLSQLKVLQSKENLLDLENKIRKFSQTENRRYCTM